MIKNSSDKHYKDFKKLLQDKSKDKELTEEESKSAYINFENFAHLLYDHAVTQIKRDKKLEKHPDGFHLNDGIYTCFLCHRNVENESSWYDKDGIKCIDCRDNLKKKVIPKYIFKKRDTWVADWEIKSKYGIHPATREKMIRDGVLKPRELKNKDDVTYFRIFILKENRNLKSYSI